MQNKHLKDKKTHKQNLILLKRREARIKRVKFIHKRQMTMYIIPVCLFYNKTFNKKRYERINQPHRKETGSTGKRQ
jgi:hypothetical protein